MKLPFINKYLHEIETVTEFKNLFVEFCDLEKQVRPGQETTDEIIILREKLNALNGEVAHYVAKANVPSSIFYSPPPAVGGIACNLDLFANLFNLRRYSVPPQMVIDALDRSIGNFMYYQKEYEKKIINPIYWIGEIIRIPFHLLKFAGFNSSKIEISLFGKIYKFLLALLALAVAVLTALDLIGINTRILISSKTNNPESTQLKQENPTISGAALAPQQAPLPKKEPRKETQK